MTGADKIIEKITRDAADESGRILARAQQRAAQTMAQAQAQAAREAEEVLAAARARAEHDIAAARESGATAEKRALLQAKNEVIARVIESAEAELKALPDAAYFDMLAKLAARHAQAGPGVMKLAQKDLDRLPPDFEARLPGVAIAREPAPIDGGFILVYGDIEQNCTLGALIADRLDDIKDALYGHIFL